MEGSDGHEDGAPPRTIVLIFALIGLATLLLICLTSHIG